MYEFIPSAIRALTKEPEGGADLGFELGMSINRSKFFLPVSVLGSEFGQRSQIQNEKRMNQPVEWIAIGMDRVREYGEMPTWHLLTY